MGNNVIKQGSLNCSSPDQEAYLADPVSCFIFQMPYKLTHIKFGYISSVFVILTILISLFGRIKLHYRWFILNMAIMDLIYCYEFICNPPVQNPPAYPICYFGLLDMWLFQGKVLNKFPLVGLFILTSSRFLSVYFADLYKKLAKTWKVILIIIIIDGAYVLFNFIAVNMSAPAGPDIFICQWTRPPVAAENLTCNGTNEEPEICLDLRRNKGEICVANLSTQAYVSILVSYIENTISPLALFASIVFVIMLIIKVMKQLKFQAQINKAALKSNIRVIIVFSVQVFILFILFILDALSKLSNEKDSNGFIFIHIEQNSGEDFTKKFPFWFQWLIKNSSMRCFREIRVLIDSVIVLAFMSGYREDLRDAILWGWKKIQKLWKR